jgi:hypothetical protein
MIQLSRRLFTKAVGITLLTATPVTAATFHCKSGDVACLVAAILAANAQGQGSTIHLDAGTYAVEAPQPRPPFNVLLPTVTSTLTIVGAGTAATFIEPRGGAFLVELGGDLTLRLLTVRGGSNAIIGGVGVNNRGHARLDQVAILSNHADGAGGGIFNEGTMTISESEVRGNSATAGAGGIQNTGTLAVFHSQISGNLGDGPGGVDNRGGRLTIRDSVIANNFSLRVGGIGNNSGGTLHMSQSALLGNIGSQHLREGAALSNRDATAVVESTTIALNAAPPLLPDQASTVVNFGGTLTLLNMTIADNQNGIQAYGGTLNVQNTIIARNGSGPECSGVITSLGNNLVENPSDCSMVLLVTDRMGDPGLGVLAGGTIPLLSTSQAIDAANDPTCPAFDQRGLPRVDGDRDGFVACDIGAVEFIAHVVEIDVTREGVFNTHSNQKVTVDVLGTPAFDVQEIDLSSIRLGATGYEAEPAQSSFKDIDRDGDVDLRLGVRAAALEVDCTSPVVALTGKTLSGDAVAGTGPIAANKCKD